MEISQNINIHNKFEFILEDAATGEIKQKATAYNMIVNSGRSAISSFLNYIGGALDGTRTFHEYFSQLMEIGRGSGTIAMTDTDLFNVISRKTTSRYAAVYDPDTKVGYYVVRGIWNPEEAMNENITEVCLRSNRIYQEPIINHALITDSEGAPISVQKGENDLLTVYCTIYFALEEPSYAGENCRLVNSESNGVLQTFLYEKGHFKSGWYLGVDISKWRYLPGTSIIEETASISVRRQDSRMTIGVENEKVYVGANYRFEASSANAAEGIHTARITWNGDTYLAMKFPLSTIFEGKEILDETIGVGDGSNAGFNLNWNTFNLNSDEIYVNDVLQVRGTDYTIQNGVKSGINAMPYCKRTFLSLYGVDTENPTGAYSVMANTYPVNRTWGLTLPASVTTLSLPYPYVIFEFETPVTANMLETYSNYSTNDYIKDYNFYGSMDNENWTLLVENTANYSVGVTAQKSFTEGTYKYFKYEARSKRGSSNVLRLTQIGLITTKPHIEFTTPPVLDAVVKANYSVPYIPKDVNHVLDFKFKINIAINA